MTLSTASASGAGGDAAARAKVEGATVLLDAHAFRAANPALAPGPPGLAAFRRWRAWAGRGGGTADAAAEEVRAVLVLHTFSYRACMVQTCVLGIPFGTGGPLHLLPLARLGRSGATDTAAGEVWAVHLVPELASTSQTVCWQRGECCY